MYQVLYRKYRPKYFADVVGQPQVTHTLKNELKIGRLSHAYLFTGSRGTGKTTCAKILSKAVNCLSPKDGDPCGECEICRGIDDGSVLDVIEIDAASNNSVEDIRSLREEVAYTPARARFRVYIIDEVHMLSAGAFNALLKTLEEPPEYVIFILATTELHKLPATILSRCQRFDFHRISQKDIADRLETVCAAEGAAIDRNAALMLAGLADGAMRDSLSLLDRCLSIGNDIDEEIVRDALGLTGKTHLIKMTDAVLSGDTAVALEIISELYNASRDMALLCDEWISHYRAMMLCKTVKNAKSLLALSDYEFQAVTEQSKKTSLESILNSLSILQEAHERMMRSVNRRTELEMTVIRMSLPQMKSSETGIGSALPPDLAERLEKLERIVTRLSSNPQVMSAAEPQTQARPPRPITKQPSFAHMEKLRQNAVPMPEWPEVIADIKKYSKAIGSSFEGSKAYISGKYVLVDSKNDICFELLRMSSQRDQVRDSIRRITGKEYSLGRYSYPDEVESDDPLVQLASDIQQAGIPLQKINDTNGGN